MIIEEKMVKLEEKIQKIADIIADVENLYRTKVMNAFRKNGFYYKIQNLDMYSRELKLNDLIYVYFKDFNNPKNLSDDNKCLTDGLFTLDIEKELENLKDILIDRYKIKPKDIDISEGSKYILKHLNELKHNAKNAIKTDLENLPIRIKIKNRVKVFSLEKAFEEYEIGDKCLFESAIKDLNYSNSYEYKTHDLKYKDLFESIQDDFKKVFNKDSSDKIKNISIKICQKVKNEFNDENSLLNQFRKEVRFFSNKIEKVSKSIYNKIKK